MEGNNVNRGELLTQIDSKFDDNKISYEEKNIIFNSVLKILYGTENVKSVINEGGINNFDRGQLVNILDVLSQHGDLGREVVEDIEATFFDMGVEIFMEARDYMDRLDDNLVMSEIVYADIDVDKNTGNVELKSHFSDDDLSISESLLLRLKNMVGDGAEIIGTTLENAGIMTDKDKPLKTRVKETILEFIRDIPEGKEALGGIASDFIGIFKDVADYTVRKTRELTYSETKRLKEEAEFKAMHDKLRSKGYEIIDSYSGTSGFSCALTKNPNSGELFLSIRGTEITDLNDIMSDYSLLIDDVPPQWEEMNAYFKEKVVPLLESEEFKGQKVTINGHSLGGALSKLLLLSNEKYIKDVYAFNSPGIAEIAEDSIDDFILDLKKLRPGKDVYVNMSYAPADQISNLIEEINNREIDKEKLKKDNLIAYNFLMWLEEGGHEINKITHKELKGYRDEYLETKIASKISDFESNKGSGTDGILNKLIVNTGEKLTTPFEIDGGYGNYKGHSISGLNTAFSSDYNRIKTMFGNERPEESKDSAGYNTITNFVDDLKNYVDSNGLSFCTPDQEGVYS